MLLYYNLNLYFSVYNRPLCLQTALQVTLRWHSTFIQLFWHYLVPYTDESPHLKLIYYLAVISGLCGLLTSTEFLFKHKVQCSWERCNIKLKGACRKRMLLLKLPTDVAAVMSIQNVFHIEYKTTAKTKYINDKGKFDSTLISCVGNIIYQIKHVPAGKLCTNYTVNHR